MKNRGTGKKWKKLRVLNSEKCDEIGRNVCTFITNIRVTAKGKRENIFFILCICINIFFFLEGAGWRDARVYTFVSRLNVLTKFVKRQHGDFSFFFFFFVFKKLVSEISARWKDLSGIYNTGSIQKSNWLTSFPVEFSIFPPKSNFDIRSRSIIIITMIRKL